MYNRFMESEDWSRMEGLIESGEISNFKVIMDNDGWWIVPVGVSDDELEEYNDSGQQIEGDGPYGVDLLEALLEHLGIGMEWV